MDHTDQSLEAIYKDAFPQVAKVLHALGADLTVTRDLFHDAMIIYLEKSRRHPSPVMQASPRQYIIGITRILWFKQCKDQRGRIAMHEMEHTMAEEEISDPEKKARLLRKYLQTAGDTCMRLLQAFYYDRLSMAAIAKKFGYGSTRSATVQKYKCLEKLRENVKKSAIYEEAIA
jgi:DNA-directed RNA polymerase specialized sigma24 family protein